MTIKITKTAAADSIEVHYNRRPEALAIFEVKHGRITDYERTAYYERLTDYVQNLPAS